jgi:hypothetical protein
MISKERKDHEPKRKGQENFQDQNHIRPQYNESSGRRNELIRPVEKADLRKTENGGPNKISGPPCFNN